MNVKNYIEDALVTESNLKPLQSVVGKELRLTDRSLHAITGIVTEIEEIHGAISHKDKVNLMEELGDVLWYVAIFLDDNECKIEGISILEIGISETNILDRDFIPSDSIITILDLYKKTMFYGKQLNLNKVNELFLTFLRELNNFVAMYDLNTERAMEINIKKLKTRYPDKFTLKRAEERDLKKERKLLEQETLG